MQSLVLVSEVLQGLENVLTAVPSPVGTLPLQWARSPNLARVSLDSNKLTGKRRATSCDTLHGQWCSSCNFRV